MRIYKYTLVAALALGTLLVCTNAGYAQQEKQGKKGRGVSVEQQIQRMDTELKLTDAQKSKLTPLFEGQRKKMQELRSDTSLSQEDRREKFRTMREENDKKLKEILTPDQWEKWQKSRQQMMQDRKGKGEGKGKKKD